MKSHEATKRNYKTSSSRNDAPLALRKQLKETTSGNPLSPVLGESQRNAACEATKRNYKMRVATALQAVLTSTVITV